MSRTNHPKVHSIGNVIELKQLWDYFFEDGFSLEDLSQMNFVDIEVLKGISFDVNDELINYKNLNDIDRVYVVLMALYYPKFQGYGASVLMDDIYSELQQKYHLDKAKIKKHLTNLNKNQSFTESEHLFLLVHFYLCIKNAKEEKMII